MNNYSKIWGGYSVYASSRQMDYSEKIILSLIMKNINIKTMVDFGCAIGRWCREGKNLGITEVLGIDGDYVNQDALVIDENEFMVADLGEYIELNKRYDLAISLEVAEHLPEEKSDTFVDNLTRASDHILFSAAVVGQGGDFHVNEQPLSYWKEKFHRKGYDMLDYLRSAIWDNDKVLPMYRQNCVMFSKNMGGHTVDITSMDNYIVDVIHPKIYKAVALKGIMLFPFHQVLKRAKLVLYGAGTVGMQYYRQLEATQYYSELVWIDKVRKQACINNKAINVQSPDILEKVDADYYIVAIEDECIAKEVIKMLECKYYVESNKIIYCMIPVTRY